MKTQRWEKWIAGLVGLGAGLVGLAGRAQELIVDGVTLNVPGGAYTTVVVKNDGVLTVAGDLQAQTVQIFTRGTIETSGALHGGVVSVAGTLRVAGNFSATTAEFLSGASRVEGTNHSVDRLTVAARLVTQGEWRAREVVVSAAGVLQVRQFTAAIPGSGTLRLLGDRVRIEAGGLIDAVAAGNDPRGQGHDWYRSAAGGGHGGQGGRGYWTSSCCGNEGQAFGTAHTYEADMGGAGGSWGGGGVFIEAEVEFVLQGAILADGQPGVSAAHGGGAGGGILVRSAAATIAGPLSARGGDGGSDSGGGGGGRIKIFYGNDDMPDFSSWVSVAGGAAGGFLNTQPGQPGSVYRDHLPRVETILAPASGAETANGSIAFRFTVTDRSAVLDGHDDAIAPRLELSRDDFATLAYVFDVDADLNGWSAPVFFSGDTVQFTPMAALVDGAYRWRITVRDVAARSRPTAARWLGVGTPPPTDLPLAGICFTPTVVLTGVPGSRCRIDYVNVLGGGESWKTLATVTLVQSPQYYFDTAAITEPRRFYRLVALP